MPLLAAGLGLLLLGAVAALLPVGTPRHRDRAFATLVIAGCTLVAGSALGVLTGTDAWTVAITGSFPGGDWMFGVDALSAFFLLAIAGVGGAAAVYGTGYLAGERAHRVVAPAHATVAVLLASLVMVVIARAAVPFLIAWEVMAIAAFLLVMFDHEEAETRRAGFIYLAATHTATLALIAMFAAWSAPAPDLTFASLAQTAAGPADRGATLVLLLALLGFGVKAGFVPLHFWLPGAHAAAPSHVSALMSGLVIKTGIYGLLRVLALRGGAPEWFGWALLVLGLVSGVLGVVWALAQHDIKRLLAYHSVENIGIILIGMGVGALGGAYGLPVVAALGYAGAILHVLNHAVFKSLLFLGAGAVARATGTRRMDALGGLGRLMPVTGVAFLLGSAAIVGLPPLNGFVSEWTIVRALLEAGLGRGAIRGAVIGVAGLGLIGGLALACFAKVNGVVFLGRARTAAAAAGHEAPVVLLAPMLWLAAGCVAIGLLPWLVLQPALAAAGVVSGALSPIPVGVVGGATWVSLAAATLIAGVAFGWVVHRALMRGRSRRVAHTWGCAYPEPTPRMQYTAASFAAPVLEPFGAIAGLSTSREGGAFRTHPHDAWLDRAIVPAWQWLRAAITSVSRLQLNRLHVSLLYVFATVIVLLGYLVLWGRGP